MIHACSIFIARARRAESGSRVPAVGGGRALGPRTSGWGHHQPSHPHQVVRGGGEGEAPAHAGAPPVPQFAEQADRLHPAEGLFDQFAFSLTDRVPRMPRGAAVEGTLAMARRGVLRDVRGDVLLPQRGDEARDSAPCRRPA